MLIFDDYTSAEVEAIVRRVLLGFRQKPPFQLLAFTSGETTTKPDVFDFCYCQGMGRNVEALYYVKKMLVWYIINYTD